MESDQGAFCKPLTVAIPGAMLHTIRRLAHIAVTLGALLAGSPGAERPNILYFLADDLGQRDLECYGSTFYETPHLDKLAREGALFTNAYASCPVCSPTRAAILTGRYPQRCGVTDYIGAAQPEAWKRNTKLSPARYETELALEELTLAECLKVAGYATGFFGKWHLGPEGRWPEDQGFHVNKGGTDWGAPRGGNGYFSPYGNPRLPDGPPGEHLPDRLATEVCKFIEANRSRPFLAYFAFYSVHTPLMAKEDLRKKYEEKRRRLGLETRWGREGERDVRLVQDHPTYAAMVEALDLAVGKVLDKLEEIDLEKKTLVIFTSDNGGLSTSEGWPTSNVPLRAGKGWLYEGGIRVPLLVRWPGVVQPGRIIETPVASIDYFPTILTAAQAPVPSERKIDGADLCPLLAGQRELEPRTLFWHYPHYGNQGGAPGAAARRDRWKLIEWYEDGRLELYDLREDPSESRDLSGTRPEELRSLREALEAWRKEVGARFPSPNPRYDPEKPSGRR